MVPLDQPLSPFETDCKSLPEITIVFSHHFCILSFSHKHSINNLWSKNVGSIDILPMFVYHAPMKNAKEKAIITIKNKGGIIRTQDVFRQGIHRRTLYGLRDDGKLISVSRGIYRLADMDVSAEVDLVEVAKAIPNGVICLVSALSFHGLTTQIPHEVWIAIERKARKPKTIYPPLKVIYFSNPAFLAGIEVQHIMGQDVRIYNAPKTVIDCFRWRNTVGIDVAIEAARAYLKRQDAKPAKLMEYAKICKIEKIVTPYLQAMIA